MRTLTAFSFLLAAVATSLNAWPADAPKTPAAAAPRPAAGGTPPAGAGAAGAARGKGPDKPSVLDFEGEVIEGQKKTPELFFQTEVQKPSLDSVLYQRKDFNDFHTFDRRQRPRLGDTPAQRTTRGAAAPGSSPGKDK